MKAAILQRLGQPLEIADLALPELHDGQILVKIAFSGVCHSQLMEARGLRGEDKFLPHLLGHEATGIVEKLGARVTKFRPGDRVILGWIRGTGLDAPGAKYYWGDKLVNSGGVTTFSEFTIVSENRCYALPDDIPMDIGVLFGCALPTGGGMVLHEINPHTGLSVAVLGLGGIGLSALMTAAAYTNRHLIGIDLSDEKLKLAKELGATHTLNSSTQNVQDEIASITENKGVDVCIEASGNARVIELGFEIIKRQGGRLVFASHPKFGEKICIDPFELISGKTIKGTWGGMSQPDRDVLTFAEFYRQGKLRLDALFTKSYSLYNINEALGDLENKRVHRPLIAIHPELR